MTLGNNIATAATLTSLRAAETLAVIERRLALLRSLGENTRNTASWRDARDEMAQFNRAVGMRTWHLRRSA